MKKKTRIDPKERDQIAFKLARGISISQIAKDLNRSKSSVSDEIKRNNHNGIYIAICCLLYTSDAADDLLCVDLGGRRIIKKKKQKNIELLSIH